MDTLQLFRLSHALADIIIPQMREGELGGSVVSSRWILWNRLSEALADILIPTVDGYQSLFIYSQTLYIATL